MKRRAKHEPLQYITGYSDFMRARISVTPDVLIPRIETEQLVEVVLDDHPADEPLRVLDIGTGSGCIPIALKMERPSWQISAVDVSEDALEIARKNAAQNEVDIKFENGDLHNHEEWSFDEPFDLIISNPPYILPEEKETLEAQVKNHEPAAALFCESIEKVYQSIIDYSAKNLGEDGQLYLELNEHHAERITALFEDKLWTCKLLKDYDKKPRFIKASLIK